MLHIAYRQIVKRNKTIPPGLVFIIRVPASESRDESDGSDKESIANNQQLNPPAPSLIVIRMDAQARPTSVTSDAMRIKTKRNYTKGNGFGKMSLPRSIRFRVSYMGCDNGPRPLVSTKNNSRQYTSS